MPVETGAIQSSLLKFTGGDLTATIANIERRISGVHAANCAAFLEAANAGREALAAAADLKRIAGQIHVTIHALGILLCLPHILEDNEKVESVSLGAGNTGRKFDLETNLRIAEFKFIKWRGGAETIRQNAVFKDFYLLESDESEKQKYLYLLGTEKALAFFHSQRKLSSILSRNRKLADQFSDRFGSTYKTVGEYYAAHETEVQIADVSPWLAELAERLIAEPIVEPDE